MAISAFGGKFRHAWQIVVAGILLVISYFAYRFYKKKEIWLFRERGTEARDNAYWMFRYIKEHHPEIEAYYTITKDSPDRERLAQWADCIIDQNSFTHYIYIWRATHMLSTHICGGYPNIVRGTKWLYCLVTWLSPKKTIWLQHGVILNDVGVRASRYNNVDMIVCSTQAEHVYLTQQCGFSEKVVKQTGLARFDQLHDYEVKHNQLLFMPTWRKWLNKDNFIDSEYFKVITNFLQMPLLHSFLEEKGLSLVFYPHHEVQKFIHCFSDLSLPSCIQIADKAHYDVQQLLKESALLITDYSSISMDFAYMQKPLIYFLFDEDRFREDHYANCEFDYHKGFGPYAVNALELLGLMKVAYSNHLKMDGMYTQKADITFPHRNTNYCKRIYNSILTA